MKTTMVHQSPLSYESYITSVPLETLLELYPIWVSFYYETEAEERHEHDDVHVTSSMMRVYEHNATITLHEIKVRVGRLVEFAADVAKEPWADSDIESLFYSLQQRAQPLAEEYYGNC